MMEVPQPFEEYGRLQTELSRLAQENEALRESARIWIRMYEKRLRAKGAVPEPPVTRALEADPLR